MNGHARVALVIPARDEARLLPGVLAMIPAWVWRVIVVDDGSRDGTWNEIQAWRDPRLVAIRHEEGLGVGAAILSGYARAHALGADVTAVVAADGQMDMNELDRVTAPVADGHADYVQGVRFASGRPRGRMPVFRQWGNRLLSAATGWAAGVRVGDSQCGFTAASAGFLARLARAGLPAGYGFPAFVRIEAHRLRARVVEVPVTACYGDEVSGIDPLRDPPRILARILWLGVARRCAAHARPAFGGAARAAGARPPGASG